jgi:TonB family protein
MNNKNKLVITALFLCAALPDFLFASSNDVGNPTVFYQQVDRPPVFFPAPRLVYPEEARREGIEGRVVIRVLIDEMGRPHAPEIIRRIPEYCLVFDQEAKRIVMESSYEPGVHQGKHVRVFMIIPVRFTLEADQPPAVQNSSFLWRVNRLTPLPIIPDKRISPGR